ncbi:MAG TPA: Hsp20/alpha crystallin family protein [Terriglobales bacterium]|jgi:HSP20 family protein|nr:Hsp20/alpha crystallin family protein [Terriglobales bacterium]
MLTRWDPFRELNVMQDRLSRLFQDYAPRGEQDLTAGNFVPPVDIYEDEQGITVKAELPGIDPKDVDVQVENNVLTIKGERKLEREEKEENFHRIERRYGSFVRSFTLPPTVDTDTVKADYENGVLKVHLAKRAEAKPKQIKVNVGQKTIEAKGSGKAA